MIELLSRTPRAGSRGAGRSPRRRGSLAPAGPLAWRAGLLLALACGLVPRAALAQALPQSLAGSAEPVLRLDLEVAAADVDRLRRRLAASAARSAAADESAERSGSVPAFTEQGGKRVELRLGILEEWSALHEGGRWPLAVRTKGDAYVFGMDRFTLRAPAIRGYQSELLMLAHLRREGVLTPRVSLVHVRMNEDDHGLMKLHESLGREMIEAQRRRGGAILRFEDGAEPVPASPGLARSPDAFQARPLVFERRGRDAKSPELAEDRKLAVALLDGFLVGAVPARSVFDVDLVARFLAVCEIWRAVDALRWPNLRFYFNPLTKQLEPIAYAASPPDLFLEEGLVTTAEAWPSALLRDGELRAAFEQHVLRIARELVEGDTQAWLRETEAPLLVVLRTEVREHPATQLAPIAARAKRLLLAAPVAMAAIAAEPRPPAASAAGVVPHNPVPTATHAEVMAQHPFLAWNADRRVFTVAAGTWQVTGSLVLPDGAGLEIEPGTTLRFGAGELLLANGPLRLRGTAEAPVVLEGLLGEDGAAGPWQGLVVLHSDRPHRWEHVIVRGTTGVERGAWKLTGGITLRESELVASDVHVLGSRAEDAINLIRSRFELRDLEVRDVDSDAFDADFCTGSVSGGIFSGVGGDAIDVSGADVLVEGTAFEGVHDKAISVGEASQLRANRVRMLSVSTGVASKDGSSTTIADSTMRKVTNAALMAYTKKSEYGSARLVARNVVMTETGSVSIAQLGSRIEIDGELQSAEPLDVDALYQLGPMQK